jgi:hypothetical protein
MHHVEAGAVSATVAEGEPDGAVQLVERLVKTLNAGVLETLDELYSETYVDHDPLPGQPAGLEGVRAGIQALGRLGREVRFHLEDCFAVGDRVAYRIFGSWTVEPELAFEASLRAPSAYQLSGVGIYRCAGGRLVERWGPWVIHGPEGPPSTSEDGP